MQGIRRSNSSIFTGISDLDKSRARHHRNKAIWFIWEICTVKYKIKRKEDDINNILYLIIYFQYYSIAQSYNIFVKTIA